MRVKQIDVLRGIAALSVTFFHIIGSSGLSKHIALYGKYGYLGVEVFFVISGFILPYSLLKTDYSVSNFPKFMFKRIIRIYPAYIIVIVLAIVMAFVTGRELVSFSTAGRDLLFISSFLGYPSASAVFWTLSIEFQFYILIGLLYKYISNSNLNSLIIIFAIVIVSLFLNNSALILHWFPFFALGILIFNRKFTKIPLVVFWASFVVLITSIIFINGLPEALAGCFAFLFILFVKIEKKTKLNRLMLWLGSISYSMYLVHWELGRAAVNFARHISIIGNSEIIKVVIGILFSILTAWILYMFIEKPSLKSANKIVYTKSKNLSNLLRVNLL